MVNTDAFKTKVSGVITVDPGNLDTFVEAVLLAHMIVAPKDEDDVT
ncbi:hypothetical protein [Corynebacterium callunae]|nr:hypothetical protein [Corynebacterium callunae]MCK2199658.1 hypothetical protein [Corynebacterium callunae]